MRYLLCLLCLPLLYSCSDSGSEKQSFKWDFRQNRKFVYSFFQTVDGENQLAANDSARKTFITGYGRLNVKVKSPEYADISLSDFKFSMVEYNLDGSKNETSQDQADGIEVEDFKPDGSFENGNLDLLFEVLFPLPKSKIAVGETDTLAIEYPFPTNSKPLTNKGYQALNFVGYEDFEGRNCAVIESEILIDKLEIPQDLEGDYESSSTGSARYYFDLEKGYMVGCDIENLIQSFLNIPAEESMNTFFWRMKSLNKYRIRLESIEEI